MRFAAVLFDLDGTLLDTLDDIAEASNHALACFGFPAHPHGAYRKFVGEGVSALFQNALPPDRRTEDWIGRCVVQFRESYAQRWNVHTKPYAGVLELLAALRAQSIRCAVLSNKPHIFTCQCVEAQLSGHKFDVVLGQRDGVPRKPDPSAAREIAARMSLPSHSFLYLGDTGVDMRTAVAAGMYPVGALWGFRPREELVEHGARVLVEHPDAVLPLLDF